MTTPPTIIPGRCPTCHAAPGMPCRTEEGPVAQRPHAQRGFINDPEWCPSPTSDHKHSESWYDCKPCDLCGDDSKPSPVTAAVPVTAPATPPPR